MNIQLTIRQDAGNKVVASFEDGTSVTVDLLVGADGIHSNIRQQFVADGKPRYSGRIAYRGLFPLKELESFWPFKSYAVSWLAKDKHFLVFPVSQNKTMNVVAFITKPEDQLGDLKESWTSVGRREDLEKEYEGWDETLCKVIKCMGPNPGKWRLNDRNPVEQWTYMDGKTVLLGDAAHAMLPHQGMFLFSPPSIAHYSPNLPEKLLHQSQTNIPYSRIRRWPRNRRRLHPRPRSQRLPDLHVFLLSPPALYLDCSVPEGPSAAHTKSANHIPPGGRCVRVTRQGIRWPDI